MRTEPKPVPGDQTTGSNAMDLPIHPDDDMLIYARQQLSSDDLARKYYLETGEELALGLTDSLLKVGKRPDECDLLDFASGFGRVSRWLRCRFRKVVVSDVEPAMLAFQERTFGTEGFLSDHSPAFLARHPGRYDVVFVFSLFTHLPEHAWNGWLTALAHLLKEDGRLVFSTHSHSLFARLDPATYSNPASWLVDFRYMESNETRGRLPTTIYGANIASDSFVQKAIEASGLVIERHYPGGDFDRYHDIYQTKRH